MGTWSGRTSTTILLLGLISAAAAFKGKARKTVKLEAALPEAALPEAAAVKGGSGYGPGEFAKYEGDSKGDKIHLLSVTLANHIRYFEGVFITIHSSTVQCYFVRMYQDTK